MSLDESSLSFTEEYIRERDGWTRANIPQASEQELINSVLQDEPDLRDDAQTRFFCKFLALATNFSSMDFKNRLSIVPEIVSSIEALINEMKKEVNEYADIANEFQNLIHCFVHLVVQTKHKLNMARDPLASSIEHIEVLSEILDSSGTLTKTDQQDISFGFDGLTAGVGKYLEYSRLAIRESKEIDDRIARLRDDVRKRVVTIDGRISFSQSLSFASPIIGAGTGGTAAAGILNSAILGGTEMVVIGGLSFGPLSAILVCAAIGCAFIGSIAFLIHKLWSRQQYKAICYLNKILHGLNRLQSANLSFMLYMNNSEESACKVLEEIDFIKKGIAHQSPRYRKRSAKICKKSIESTRAMVECIDEISKIDIHAWAGEIQSMIFNKTMFING